MYFFTQIYNDRFEEERAGYNIKMEDYRDVFKKKIFRFSWQKRQIDSYQLLINTKW